MEYSESCAMLYRHKTYNKVFCIGCNKTGTTSLENVLRRLGFSVPRLSDQEARITVRSCATDYRELVRFVDRYDAFRDRPFSRGELYVAVDALFPDSRFILTEREPEAWFNSLCNFNMKKFKLAPVEGFTAEDLIKKADYLYPGYLYEANMQWHTNFAPGSLDPQTHWDKQFDRDFQIERYLARNERIKTYFMHAPEKLLVVDVTKEETTKRICEFLNLPESSVFPMPHLNATTPRN